MKSTASVNPIPYSNEFPKLMIVNQVKHPGHNYIILATSIRHEKCGGSYLAGVIVKEDSGEFAKNKTRYIGEWSDEWNAGIFVNYYGTVTLEND